MVYWTVGTISLGTGLTAPEQGTKLFNFLATLDREWIRLILVVVGLLFMFLAIRSWPKAFDPEEWLGTYGGQLVRKN
ncbi:hypothetical protein BH18ACT6_BH18ACT6_26090 [soil metagenome]|nr:hypothetical protein [Actinomycetota bacterium]